MNSLKVALAAGLMTAATAAQAAGPVGIMDQQALKEIGNTQCVITPSREQATYGVSPNGKSWMLDIDRRYSDPPAAKMPCERPSGSTYGILPHGQSWMVDYAGK